MSQILGRIKKIRRRNLFLVAVAAIIALIAATSTYVFFIAPSSAHSIVITPTEDYDLWVKPYLSQLAMIEGVLTHSYSPGTHGSYGYDSALGLVCGGDTEPSAAISVYSGYNNVCVLIDNNLEGGASLDYFASPASPLLGQPGFNEMNLHIYTNTRNYLSMPFYGIGPCSPPFEIYSYPANFSLLERTETEYGFAGPYVSVLIQPGIHVGDVGTLTCDGETEQGQVWYLENNDNPDSTMIATELPSSTPPLANSSLDELSFVIDELYMQCVGGTTPCSQWQSAYQYAMSEYPFPAPRDALHFVQVTRATGAWAMSNMSYNGVSAETMLKETISDIFTPQDAGGALGANGGLSQSWGKGADDTPEPNFQALVAFDPRMPAWFSTTCMKNATTCLLS